MKYDWNTSRGRSRPTLRVGMLVGSTSVTGGGVIEAVRSLALALDRRADVSVTIFAPDDGKGVRSIGNIPIRLAPVRGPLSFGYAPQLVQDMSGSDFDILHVHGLWMYLSIAARYWARATGRPYVVSPHGMLDPWALRHNGLKKRLARLFYENAHLKNAASLHALCQAEAVAVRQAGVQTSIKVLPNGVELPAAGGRRAPWRLQMPDDAKVLLFLGRVTRKKQVVELIRAFDRSPGGSRWYLVIVGPVEEGYRAAIDAAVSAAFRRDRIHIAGPAYGEDRASAYASADLFVLPSISEGLPMAALEAFAFGIPALLTPQCNLPEAIACGAAMETDPSEDGIADGLGQVFSMSPDELKTMGERARHLAAGTFNWDRIAAQMADLYVGLIEAQERSPLFFRALNGRAGLPA